MNATAGVFLQWGVLQISLANFIIIVVMVALFGLALLIPFPHAKESSTAQETHDERS
ncbi:MAG: hypothetical protein M3Z00_07005 [Actinomycetota bacterium]|nr:hypothetical protein [Actinomycetota bacterium]